MQEMVREWPSAKCPFVFVCNIGITHIRESVSPDFQGRSGVLLYTPEVGRRESLGDRQ